MQPVRKYPITTPYGKKGGWLAGYHTGQDYACPIGTWVRASKRGKVAMVGVDSAYGNFVVIQSWHRGRRIKHLYAHLSRAKVLVGQRVETGKLIGLSGNSGNSTGPHVHYEERVAPFGYWNHIKPVLPEWTPRKETV